MSCGGLVCHYPLSQGSTTGFTARVEDGVVCQYANEGPSLDYTTTTSHFENEEHFYEEDTTLPSFNYETPYHQQPSSPYTDVPSNNNTSQDVHHQNFNQNNHFNDHMNPFQNENFGDFGDNYDPFNHDSMFQNFNRKLKF